MTKEEGGTEPSPQRPAADRRTSLAVDFGPLLVFAVAYRFGGIYWATGAFMVASPVALAIAWARERKLRPLPLVTAAVVLLFGGLTIGLDEPRFIYVKPTIVMASVGLVLLGGLLLQRSLLEPLLGSALALSARGWRALTVRYALFSLALAALNELVWRSFEEGTWVWFKFLGIPGLTLVFFAAQMPMLKRFAEPPDVGAVPGE